MMCTVSGPLEAKAAAGGKLGNDRADIRVSISVAGFSGVDRKRSGRNDKYATHGGKINEWKGENANYIGVDA